MSAPVKVVSDCCGADVTAYRSPKPDTMNGPQDPVEVCDECGEQCLPVEMLCGNCKNFMVVAPKCTAGFCLGDAPKALVDVMDEYAADCDAFGIETEPHHYVGQPDY